VILIKFAIKEAYKINSLWFTNVLVLLFFTEFANESEAVCAISTKLNPVPQPKLFRLIPLTYC